MDNQNIVSSDLTFVGSVNVVPAARLVASEFFNIDNSAVKIICIGDTFRACFLDKIEETTSGEVTLYCHKLKKDLTNTVIVQKFGSKLKSSLAVVASCMLIQPNGESDGLLDVDFASSNIFHAEDVNGVLRAVVLVWAHVGDGGWCVHAVADDDTIDEWDFEDQVFFLDS